MAHLGSQSPVSELVRFALHEASEYFSSSEEADESLGKGVGVEIKRVVQGGVEGGAVDGIPNSSQSPFNVAMVASETMSPISGGDVEVGGLSPILDEALRWVIPKGMSLRDVEVGNLPSEVPGFTTHPVVLCAISIRLFSQGCSEAVEGGAGEAGAMGGDEGDR